MPFTAAPRHFAGLFVLSAATLLLELALTRLLSVALWYHFGFLVVSTALLGFGAAGVLLAAWPRLREAQDLDRALAILAALLAGAIALAWIATRQIPFDPFSLSGDKRQLLFGPLFEALWALPFFVSGLAIALLLGRGGAQVNRLYGADLAGAALGCALLPVVMTGAGGPGSLGVAAALALAAGALFAGARRLRWLLAGAAAVALACAPLVERALPVRITANKFPPQYPIWQGWNTLSFLQVEAIGGGGAEPARRRIVIDGGTAMTAISDLRLGIGRAAARPPGGERIDGAIAWPLKQAPRVLVIGSGAGEELVDAVAHGSPRAVGVEVNPLIVWIGRVLMRDFWGGLFDHPAIEVVADEARSWLRRSPERFDAILATHTISNAALASGALGLAENYVLTREAFGDWLAHLLPGGILDFTRPEAQLLRLTATVREAWDAAGIAHPEQCVVVWRRPLGPALRGRMGAARSAFLAGVLAKNAPFSVEEVREIERRLRVGDPTSGGLMSDPAEILYSPFRSGLDPRYEEALTTADLPGFYRSMSDEVAPVTDDRPFFNQRVRWSRISLADVRDVLGQGAAGRLAMEDRPIAEVTLLWVLLQSALLAALFLLLPLWRFARTGLSLRRSLPALAWFAALGFGFILIEMALLQRYTLYLGQPVFSLAVVLAALLLSSGAGSALAGRIARPLPALRWLVPLLVVALAATALGGRLLFAATLGWPFAARVAMAALSLAPLGLLLGMPFSTSLRALQGGDARLLPWAWGVNGFATVLGTVLGLFCGMTLGFDATLAIAAGTYLLGLGAAQGLRAA